MTTLFTKESRDSSGQQLVWSDTILGAVFYDTTGEAWDKQASLASWYTERLLPHDTFYQGLAADRWVLEGGGISKTCTVSGGALFNIDADEGSLYISSEGLWSLSGNFKLVLGVNQSTYYDEYRSATSFGFNACFGSEYNIRAALVTNYEDVTAGAQMLYTDGGDPRYFGWSAASESIGSGKSYSSLIMERVGDTVSCKAGSTLLGTISGTHWEKDCYIKIGVECSEINSFYTMADYFTVESGTLATGPALFSSPFRGVSLGFPTRSLVVADAEGVSIIEYPTMSLWARMRAGSSFSIPEGPSSVAAAGGRVYCVSDSGLRVIDFTTDTTWRYAGSLRYESTNKLCARNARMTYHTPSATGGLLSDAVSGVSARAISGTPFVGVATASGVNVIIDGATVKYGIGGEIPTSAVHITEDGGLFWGGTNANNEGDLSYYSNVALLTTATGTSFARTGYFDSGAGTFTLTSERFNQISSDFDGTVSHLALAHPGGIDVLLYPPTENPRVETFSISIPDNTIEDPGFSNLLGVSWRAVRSRSQPVATVTRESSWSTLGTYSLKLAPGNPNITNYYTSPGDYTGVYQRVDLTNIERLYFDVKLVGGEIGTDGECSYQVRVGADVLASFDEPSHDEVVIKLSESIDVSEYTGLRDFLILVVVNGGTVLTVPRYCLFDNFRVQDHPSGYAVLGGTDPSVLAVGLQVTPTSKKVSYVKADGYGVVDLTDLTSDFFIPAAATLKIPSLSGGVFIEYDDS